MSESIFRLVIEQAVEKVMTGVRFFMLATPLKLRRRKEVKRKQNKATYPVFGLKKKKRWSKKDGKTKMSQLKRDV